MMGNSPESRKQAEGSKACSLTRDFIQKDWKEGGPRSGGTWEKDSGEAPRYWDLGLGTTHWEFGKRKTRLPEA